MGSRGLLLGGLGVWVGCRGRHFSVVYRLGPLTSMKCAGLGANVGGQTSLLLYMWSMCPRRSKGKIASIIEKPQRVWRHVFNCAVYICKLQCRGSIDTFNDVNSTNECGVVSWYVYKGKHFYVG